MEVELNQKEIKRNLCPARARLCIGFAERIDRSILEMTRAFMADSDLPMYLWAETLSTDIYI